MEHRIYAYFLKKDLTYAVKIIKKHSLDDLHTSLCKREVQVIQELDHPSIIRLQDYFNDPEKISLVFDYCSEGDLDSIISA